MAGFLTMHVHMQDKEIHTKYTLFKAYGRNALMSCHHDLTYLCVYLHGSVHVGRWAATIFWINN